LARFFSSRKEERSLRVRRSGRPDEPDRPAHLQIPDEGRGAFDHLLEIFGEAWRHSGAPVGVMQLPFGAAIQLEMTCA
jgi:hypothetical protein